MPPRLNVPVDDADLVRFARQEWSSIANNRILYVMQCIVVYFMIYNEAPPYDDIMQRFINNTTNPPSNWYGRNTPDYKFAANTLRRGRVTSDVLRAVHLRIGEDGDLNDLRILAQYSAKDRNEKMLDNIAKIHATITAYTMSYGVSFMKGIEPRKKFSTLKSLTTVRWPTLRDADTAFIQSVFKPEYWRTPADEADSATQASAAAQHELQPSQPNASPVYSPSGSPQRSQPRTPPRVAAALMNESPEYTATQMDDETSTINMADMSTTHEPDEEALPASMSTPIILRIGHGPGSDLLSLSPGTSNPDTSYGSNTWRNFMDYIETSFTPEQREDAERQMRAFISTHFTTNSSSNSDINRTPDTSS